MKSALQHALSLICKIYGYSKNGYMFALLSHCFTQISELFVIGVHQRAQPVQIVKARQVFHREGAVEKHQGC